MNQPIPAEFFGTPVSVHEHAGKRWLTSEAAGLCLGYPPDTARQSIGKIYERQADEFTDAELDILALYASGKSTDDVLREKGWSRHTLHEYNANLLRKAKALFVYDFKNARDFAEYCYEKGFVRLKS